MSNDFRNNITILAELLTVTSAAGPDGILRSHLMHRVNLNSRQLQIYVDLTLRTGLITSDNASTRTHYLITDKGFQYINVTRELLRLLKTDPEEVKPFT